MLSDLHQVCYAAAPPCPTVQSYTRVTLKSAEMLICGMNGQMYHLDDGHNLVQLCLPQWDDTNNKQQFKDVIALEAMFNEQKETVTLAVAYALLPEKPLSKADTSGNEGNKPPADDADNKEVSFHLDFFHWSVQNGVVKDVNTASVLHVPLLFTPFAILYSNAPNFTGFLVSGSDHNIHLYDGMTKDAVNVLTGALASAALCMTIFQDMKWLACGCQSGALVVVPLSDNGTMMQVYTDGPLTCIQAITRGEDVDLFVGSAIGNAYCYPNIFATKLRREHVILTCEMFDVYDSVLCAASLDISCNGTQDVLFGTSLGRVVAFAYHHPQEQDTQKPDQCPVILQSHKLFSSSPIFALDQKQDLICNLVLLTLVGMQIHEMEYSVFHAHLMRKLDDMTRQ